MRPRREIERTLRQHLPDLRRRFKVRRIGVFGSVVRGEQHGRSDLDILVEYSETPSLLAIVALKRHLSELTGEKVDLVPASALKPAYRRIILNEVVYARGAATTVSRCRTSSTRRPTSRSSWLA